MPPLGNGEYKFWIGNGAARHLRWSRREKSERIDGSYDRDIARRSRMDWESVFQHVAKEPQATDDEIAYLHESVLAVLTEIAFR